MNKGTVMQTLFLAVVHLLSSSRIPSVFGSADEPIFVEQIENVTVTAGRDVKLTCAVENLGTYKVAWIAFDKSAILTVQEHVITRNPRVNISYDGHRTWTLHLSKVNASDAGTYMCQVNTIVAKSQFGIIKVVVPPNILDSDSSGDSMVQEGANVTLTCSATGHPEPEIVWKREDRKNINLNRTHSVPEYSGASLRLSRVSRTDMAAYLCIARNGIPPIVSKRIKVDVNFPPMMNIPHQLVGAPVGYNFTLECTIEAHPQALTYWKKGNNTMIHQSEKFVISEKSGEEPYRTHMKLTVTELSEDDYGAYKCVAKNSRGETEGEMKLYKSQRPTPSPTSPPYFIDKIFKGSQNKIPKTVYNHEDDISESGDRVFSSEREMMRFETGNNRQNHRQYPRGYYNIPANFDDFSSNNNLFHDDISNNGDLTNDHKYFLDSFFSSSPATGSSLLLIIALLSVHGI